MLARSLHLSACFDRRNASTFVAVQIVLLALSSPLLMLIVALVVVSLVNRAHPKARWSKLVLLSVIYGAVGAVASLIWTLHEMKVYERQTGYGAGNGPLAWIYLYGPLSFAFGQALALLHWCVFPRRLRNPSDHGPRTPIDSEEERL
jgi:hypothetical protein